MIYVQFVYVRLSADTLDSTASETVSRLAKSLPARTSKVCKIVKFLGLSLSLVRWCNRVCFDVGPLVSV